MIKAQIEILLKPFVVPGAAEIDGGSSAVKLSEIHSDSLSQLCDDFRKKVFQDAGKQDPRLK